MKKKVVLMVRGGRLEFSVSDAMNLPFADASFDAAYHFGGFAFSQDGRRWDRKDALSGIDVSPVRLGQRNDLLSLSV